MPRRIAFRVLSCNCAHETIPYSAPLRRPLGALWSRICCTCATAAFDGRYGSAAKKHELSIQKGAGIDSSVRAFCKQYEVNDKECTTLSTQVTAYLLKQSAGATSASAPPAAAPAVAAAPAAASAAAGAGTPSPIDFETKVDVKSKKGGPPRKETLKIVRGARP